MRPDRSTLRSRSTCAVALVVSILLAGAVAAHAVDPNQFREMYVAGDYAGLVAQCDANRAEIDQHEFVDRLLYYCGQARFKLYETSGEITDATEAVKELELSAYYYYVPDTAFALGKARLAAIDEISDDEERIETLHQGLDEMWEAIEKQRATEYYPDKTASNRIIGWAIDYYESLIDRIIKAQDDPALVRWMTARARMLTDRFAKIDPTIDPDEQRRFYLDAIHTYMRDLYEATYFDNNPVVGLYRYKGDRRLSDYDQTEATRDQFVKSLYYYTEGLARTRSLKAKADLHNKIAILCTYFQSERKDEKVEYYKQGFLHAAEGIKLMRRLATQEKERDRDTYRYEASSPVLVADLEKNYGSNLAGLIYFLWERKDYKTVVALRSSAFDTGFDWETKPRDLLRIADSASRLARKHIRDRRLYAKYKEMCLTSASRAFKFTLKKYGGKLPKTYDGDVCESMQAYSGYLLSFGETVEATNLDRTYGTICGDGPPEGAAASQEVGS